MVVVDAEFRRPTGAVSADSASPVHPGL